MATIVTTRPSPAARPRTASPAPPHLSLNTSQRGTPTAVPHKHIPYCSPGPRPTNNQLSTPPASPPALSDLIDTTSIIYPPIGFTQLSKEPPIYSITAAKLEEALEHLASQPLPYARQVFPWLHGLHADNQLQLAFFIARKKSLRRTPPCIRGLTIVKAGGDLSHSKIKGAIAPEELLKPCCNSAPSSPRKKKHQQQSPQQARSNGCDFIDIDPRDGFSVRNFQIQACKMATVSDIVVYGDMETPRREVELLAARLAKAQIAWYNREDLKVLDGEKLLFNTFVLSDEYDFVETDHPNLVALDADGCMTTKVMDFFHWERLEMFIMSAATEISHNVWLGPTPEPSLMVGPQGEVLFDDPGYDFMIEANDLAPLPDTQSLKLLEDLLERDDFRTEESGQIQLEFPGSGSIMPPTWSHCEVDRLLETCQWLYKQANPPPEARHRRDSKLSLSTEQDADRDQTMTDVHDGSNSATTGRKVLIHCSDGYTESSLLALAYYMYAEGARVHEAWLALHKDKGRNFFAYSSDVALLRLIEPRILNESPRRPTALADLCQDPPAWLNALDGSLPSRILPYMYLGNLGHANNPALLRELGIGQILSVGEPVAWTPDTVEGWPAENLMFVDKVQDNGVDPLMEEFGRCLEFIESGRAKGTATLVHCRVGVSRSATICIAEVMNELGLSFPRAYCFVRARRLNVIIQPHLRFCYELLKWEEKLCEKRGEPLRRELEWASIAREIAAMNKPYSKQK